MNAVGHGEGLEVALHGGGPRELVDEVHRGAGDDGRLGLQGFSKPSCASAVRDSSVRDSALRVHRPRASEGVRVRASVRRRAAAPSGRASGGPGVANAQPGPGGPGVHAR